MLPSSRKYSSLSPVGIILNFKFLTFKVFEIPLFFIKNSVDSSSHESVCPEGFGIRKNVN